MIRYVLVDDLREINADVVFRTFESAIQLAEHIDWSEVTLLLDHDLGTQGATTGYDFLVYLLDNELLPKDITIVSSNPVGVNRIIAALENHGWWKQKSPDRRMWKCEFHDALK